RSTLFPYTTLFRSTEIITHIIDSYHYKKKPLDDALSSAIFDRYLESLDPNKSYFLASDIREFEKYRNQLDDALNKQALTPAYKIFKIYHKRDDERAL